YDYPVPGTFPPVMLPNSGLVVFYHVAQGRDAEGDYVLNATPTGYYTVPAAHQGMGFSVAMDGNTAVVGNTCPPGWFTGATTGSNGTAYVFTHNGTAWSNGPTAALSNSGFTASHHYGSSVAVSGDMIAVGAF